MPLAVSTINPRVLAAEYAVRGPIVARASEIAEELKIGGDKAKEKYNFKKVIFCNIGNPQAVQQPALTYPRDVSALLTAPELLNHAKINQVYNADVVRRASSMVREMGNTGGYTDSAGYAFTRKHVAEFITNRDRQGSGNASLPASDFKDIFLSNGASQSVTYALQLLIGSNKDGVMIPIPQYPLYTATLALLDGAPVPYYLNEAKGWAITAAELESSYKKAKKDGINVKAIVVINPGNPTGQVLDVEMMREVVAWAHKRKIVLLADEVYQANIYAEGKKFHSMREVMYSLGGDVAKELQLFSFHSASKGIHGECGRRGGYVELINFPTEVVHEYVKLQSIGLCPNIMGQLMMDLVVKGPEEQGESYAQFRKEYDDIFASLKRRAVSLPLALRKVPGITCNDIEGAMYAFPQIRLPTKYIAEAKKQKKHPDAMWCLGLVEQEGVVTVPGSGFGQVDGTFHFRTTILPPDEEMDEMARRIDAYQRRIIEKYGPVEGAKL
jgi:aspartate/methionine/tyrosine aminotransferase